MMRVSLAAAACGISIALLAGCSTSRDSSTLPISGLAESHGLGVQPDFRFPPGGIGYKGMLKWFAAGKMRGPAPRWFMKEWLQDFVNRGSFHPQVVRNGHGVLGLWAYSNYNWLLGVTANGRQTVYAINTYENNCESGGGMKVDGNGNAWIACADWYNGMDYYGSAEEYSNTGTLVNSYKGGCPSNLGGCQVWDAFSDDVAPDGNGGLYVGDQFALPCIGSNPSSCYYNDNGTGWEYFANPSAQPVYSDVYGNQPAGCSTNCTKVDAVFSFDVDGSGNIWTVFHGCESYGYSYCGAGIAEVTGVSSGTANFNVVVPPGALPGTLSTIQNGEQLAIYVAGNTATVSDGSNRTVYQYTLPITPSSTPSILGVTVQNAEFCGDPFQGGFNASGGTFAAADLCGWVDTLQGRRARALTNINFAGITAAGFVPSNK